MTAQIIDGKALAEELRQSFKARVEALTAQGHQPGLVVILVGEDPASQVYVKNKVNGCLAIGMHSEKIVYDRDVDQQVVLDKIAELNADPSIHGILVQLPLPRHFDEERVLEAISAEKDVDGFHAENVGALSQGAPRFIPCTPYGVMKMFEKGNVDLTGQEAVVIGRSNIVGKPMAMLLINAGAAVGKPKFVKGDMIKPGAVVIDVGINRLPDGKLCGDVDYEDCLNVAGQITPVPGGVGPMTITMLLPSSSRTLALPSKPVSCPPIAPRTCSLNTPSRRARAASRRSSPGLVALPTCRACWPPRPPCRCSACRCNRVPSPVSTRCTPSSRCPRASRSPLLPSAKPVLPTPRCLP